MNEQKCCPEKSQQKEVQTIQLYQEQLRSEEGGLVLLVALQVDLVAAQELLPWSGAKVAQLVGAAEEGPGLTDDMARLG